VTCENPCGELPDLADGPLERCNLAFAPAASGVLSDLMGGLRAWIEQTPDLRLSGTGASLSCCRALRVPNVEMAPAGLGGTG